MSKGVEGVCKNVYDLFGDDFISFDGLKCVHLYDNDVMKLFSHENTVSVTFTNHTGGTMKGKNWLKNKSNS